MEIRIARPEPKSMEIQPLIFLILFWATSEITALSSAVVEYIGILESMESSVPSSSLTTSAGGGKTGKGDQGDREKKKEKGPPRSASGVTVSSSSSSSSRSSNSRVSGGAPKPAPVEQVRKKPALTLFDHLARRAVVSEGETVDGGPVYIHQATIRVGGAFRTGQIQHDDQRIDALVSLLKEVVGDFAAPISTTTRLSTELDKTIKAQVNYLVQCRQLSLGMGNLIKFLRTCIAKLPIDATIDTARGTLLGKLQNFSEERVAQARLTIAKKVQGVIQDGDVILTYGWSDVVTQALLTAAKTKTFRVVIVDSRPLNHGLSTLQALSSSMECVYTPLTGALSMLNQTTRVIVGASCLLANGAVLAPAGTAMIALMARTAMVPFIVAAESYKFSERVQLDSIVNNELGAEEELININISASESGESGGADDKGKGKGKDGSGGNGSGGNGKDKGKEPSAPRVTVSSRENPIYMGGASAGLPGAPDLPFQVINLRYDLTPLKNISLVATEMGMLPATSLPLLASLTEQEDEEEE